MIGVSATPDIETTTGLCVSCGIPLDSQYFDESSVLPAPSVLGDEVVLARFELPAQYCGVLQYFSQFTDAFGGNFANIQTPTIEWRLRVNNQALFPYISLRHIANPWGYGSYPVNIRLAEDSTIELIARRVTPNNTLPIPTINLIGGRIMGRFWYNASYGDVR
jgi:hypothetical protein